MKIKLSITDMLPISVMFFISLDLAYRVDRQNFTHLIFDYTLLFLLYFYILNQVQGTFEVPRTYLFFAIILRGCLIFSVPNLSEDIYRFIWDGRLISLGINPFDYKPNYYFDNHLYPHVLTPELYHQLNSKNYFTVYPPVCQTVFALAAWLFPKSIYGSMVVIKSFIFACEVGSIFLLKQMLKHGQKVLVYALNPLIIIELCGNAHFEASMIFFFLAAVYFFKKLGFVNQFVSILFYALSIASKMLPLVLMPFFIRIMGWKKAFFYGIVVGMFLILLFLPLYNDLFLKNISNSLNLYFQKFEFNASVYYIYSYIETTKWGFNPIITISRNLNIAVIIFIVFLVFYQKQTKNTEGVAKNRLSSFTFSDKPISQTVFFEKCLFTLSLYFLCAAVVHPWYASFLLLLSVFTRYRYVVLWTALLPFTYIHYSYPQPTENFWVIGFEYTFVIGYFIFEQFFQNVHEKEQLQSP